jgi:DNA/RNA endonuclease YhcR with UshA esterase domain
MKIIISLSCALILFMGSTAFAQQKIKAEDAKSHIGQKDTATVIGKVFHIKTTDKATFIDIGAQYPDNPFTVFIFDKDMKAVGDLSKYDGKTIEITGLITDHNGKPEIVVSDAKQLKIEE